MTVHTPNNVRLHLVRGDPMGGYDFVRPTGDDAFGDGVPTLFLGRASGGSAIDGYSLIVIRLIGATEDVSPAEPLFPLRVEYDLGRAGRVIMALDFRWTHLFSWCRSSGRTAAYFVWRRGRYVPACNRFPTQYRRAANFWREDIAPDRNLPAAYLEGHRAAALEMAQAGHTAEAIRYLHDAIARGRNGEPAAASRSGYDADAAAVETALGPVLAAAHANRRRPCPLSQLQVARRQYGSESLEDWLRTLRPSPNPVAPQ